MIKVKVNPINIVVFAAIVAFSFMAYVGHEMGVSAWAWVFFTVLVIGIGYLGGYFAHYYDEWFK